MKGKLATQAKTIIHEHEHFLPGTNLASRYKFGERIAHKHVYAPNLHLRQRITLDDGEEYAIHLLLRKRPGLVGYVFVPINPQNFKMIIGFRGTKHLASMLSDAELQGVGHETFQSSEGLILSQLNTLLGDMLKTKDECKLPAGQTKKLTVMVTGHSLGGALAQLLVVSLMKKMLEWRSSDILHQDNRHFHFINDLILMAYNSPGVHPLIAQESNDLANALIAQKIQVTGYWLIAAGDLVQQIGHKILTQTGTRYLAKTYHKNVQEGIWDISGLGILNLYNAYAAVQSALTAHMGHYFTEEKGDISDPTRPTEFYSSLTQEHQVIIHDKLSKRLALIDSPFTKTIQGLFYYFIFYSGYYWLGDDNSQADAEEDLTPWVDVAGMASLRLLAPPQEEHSQAAVVPHQRFDAMPPQLPPQMRAFLSSLVVNDEKWGGAGYPSLPQINLMPPTPTQLLLLTYAPDPVPINTAKEVVQPVIDHHDNARPAEQPVADYHDNARAAEQPVVDHHDNARAPEKTKPPPQQKKARGSRVTTWGPLILTVIGGIIAHLFTGGISTLLSTPVVSFTLSRATKDVAANKFVKAVKVLTIASLLILTGFYIFSAVMSGGLALLPFMVGSSWEIGIAASILGVNFLACLGANQLGQESLEKIQKTTLAVATFLAISTGIILGTFTGVLPAIVATTITLALTSAVYLLYKWCCGQPRKPLESSDTFPGDQPLSSDPHDHPNEDLLQHPLPRPDHSAASTTTTLILPNTSLPPIPVSHISISVVS